MNRLREDGKNAGADRVEWDIDSYMGFTKRASRRFVLRSEDWQYLVRRGKIL